MHLARSPSVLGPFPGRVVVRAHSNWRGFVVARQLAELVAEREADEVGVVASATKAIATSQLVLPSPPCTLEVGVVEESFLRCLRGLLRGRP